MVHHKTLFVSFIVLGILASLVEAESTKDVAKSTKHAQILGGKKHVVKSSKKTSTSTLDSILKAQKNNRPKIFILNFEKAKLKKLVKTLHKGGDVVYKEDPCLYKPCLHNGLCHNDLSRGPYSHICTCSIGYSGSRCQNEVPECGIGSCEGGQCLSAVDGSLCRCSEGFEGFVCQTRSGRRSPVYNSVKDDITDDKNRESEKMGRHSMLALSVVTGVMITIVLCCFIQACRVWSKRSDLKYYYREAIKNGLDVPAPPDTCTICGQICLETFCSCGAAGNRKIEDINKRYAMNQHQQMTKENLNEIITERLESPDKSGLNVIRSKISQMSDKSRDILVDELEKRSVSFKPSSSPDVEEWVENLRKASIVLSQSKIISSQAISQTSARKSSDLSIMVNKSEDPEQTKETIDSEAESSSESDDASILSPEQKAMLQNEELENCLVDLVTRLSELEMSQPVSSSKVDIPNNMDDKCEDGIHNRQTYDKDSNNLENTVDQQTESQDPGRPDSPPISLIRIKSISVVRQPQESTNEPGLDSQHQNVGIRKISLMPLPTSMHSQMNEFDPSNTVSIEDNSVSLQPVEFHQGDKTQNSSSRGLNIENPMFHDHRPSVTSRISVSPGSRQSITQRMSISNHDPIQASRNNSSSEYINRPQIPNDSIRRVSFTQTDSLPLPSLSSDDAYSDTEPNSVTSVNETQEGVNKTEALRKQSQIKKECSNSPDVNPLDYSDAVGRRMLPNNNFSRSSGIYSKTLNVLDRPVVSNWTGLNQAVGSYESLSSKRYSDSRLSKTDLDWSCSTITLTPTSIHTIESPNQNREPAKSLKTEDPITKLKLDEAAYAFSEEFDQQDIDEDVVADVVNFNMSGNYLSDKIQSLRQPGEDADDEADEEDGVYDKNNSRSTTGRRKRIVPTISTRSSCPMLLQEQITDVLVTGHVINGVAEDVDMQQHQKDDPTSQHIDEEFRCTSLPILNMKRNADQLILSSIELPKVSQTRPENMDECAKDAQFTIINECAIGDCQEPSNNISRIDNSAHILLNRKQNGDTFHLQIGEIENTQKYEITGDKHDGEDENLQIVGDKEDCELPTVEESDENLQWPQDEFRSNSITTNDSEENMHVTVDIHDAEEQAISFHA